MKIVIAAICKNESKNVKRWVNQSLEADAIFVHDTGSDDDTFSQASFELIKSGHKRYNVSRQEFDKVDFSKFRNALLSNILRDCPNFDYVFYVDFDEILEPGWRAKLENHLHNDSGKIIVHRYENPGRYLTQLERVFKLQSPGKWVKRLHEGFVFDDDKYNHNLTIASDIILEHQSDRSSEKLQMYDSIIMSCVKIDPRHFLYFYFESIYTLKEYDRFLTEWVLNQEQIEEHVDSTFRHLLYRYRILSSIKSQSFINEADVEKYLQLKNRSALFRLSKLFLLNLQKDQAIKYFDECIAFDGDELKYFDFTADAYDEVELEKLKQQIMNLF